jgi:hypothetical protein
MNLVSESVANMMAAQRHAGARPTRSEPINLNMDERDRHGSPVSHHSAPLQQLQQPQGAENVIQSIIQAAIAAATSSITNNSINHDSSSTVNMQQQQQQQQQHATTRWCAGCQACSESSMDRTPSRNETLKQLQPTPIPPPQSSSISELSAWAIWCALCCLLIATGLYLSDVL